MIYVLLILILVLYLYFGLSHKREYFIRYSKENDNSKANGIDFSNYNVYYEKIVSGDKLTGSFNVGGEMITFNNEGAPNKNMTLEQLKKTAESLGDRCVGFVFINSVQDNEKTYSIFLKSVTELLSDPLSLEKNLTEEQKQSYKNELMNYRGIASFIKKFTNRKDEQNIPDFKDVRALFSRNECAIIDGGKNDIIQFKGTLDECKTKCASYNNCQVFNRGKDINDSQSAECILKNTYQNKEGLCLPDNKYVSYSRGGQIKYEILEIKERERIERERIEKERREREERERKERERIERERREREERERRERQERERREREEREKREREERERNERERNMVVYNGNTYKTLSDWDKNSNNHECQQNWITIPNGWRLAPNNQDSITVIQSKNWSTSVLAIEDGHFWYVGRYRQYGRWHPGGSHHYVHRSGNQMRVSVCHGGILLIKDK